MLTPQALLYGSKSARELGSLSAAGQHSKIVGRNKYVHKKITHAVVPSRRAEYLEAAQAYYTTLTRRSAELGGVKLTGSWETVIGAVGEYTHILEYEGHKGLDETMRTIRKDPVSCVLHLRPSPTAAPVCLSTRLRPHPCRSRDHP